MLFGQLESFILLFIKFRSSLKYILNQLLVIIMNKRSKFRLLLTILFQLLLRPLQNFHLVLKMLCRFFISLSNINFHFRFYLRVLIFVIWNLFFIKLIKFVLNNIQNTWKWFFISLFLLYSISDILQQSQVVIRFSLLALKLVFNAFSLIQNLVIMLSFKSSLYNNTYINILFINKFM